MLTLIEGGDVYAPKARGRQSILTMFDRIAAVGSVDRAKVEALGLELEVIDARDCVVVPGFVDPHVHLLGGSGEQGFSSQSPEIQCAELIEAGLTTVVGVLGVDTTMKTMPGLLARVKGLREQGLNAFLWTGGYNVPPTCIMGSVRDDILFIEEVIGAGEIAIADERSTNPEPRALAHLVSDAYIGGMLSQKAGRTHFHVGSHDERLSLLREILDEYHVKAECIYATHINRSRKLIEEAVELAARGAWVDTDTVEEDLDETLNAYLSGGGDPERLTVSSDASESSPATMTKQLRSLVTEHGRALEDVLPLATSTTARALGVEKTTGSLVPGLQADLLVLEKGSLEILDMLVRGQRLIRDGRIDFEPRFLEKSSRQIHLEGKKGRA